ncbi:MAG: hypothetical protein ACD_79C01273G0001, partial [uncultured bacterium]
MLGVEGITINCSQVLNNRNLIIDETNLNSMNNKGITNITYSRDTYKISKGSPLLLKSVSAYVNAPGEIYSYFNAVSTDTDTANEGIQLLNG